MWPHQEHRLRGTRMRSVNQSFLLSGPVLLPSLPSFPLLWVSLHYFFFPSFLFSSFLSVPGQLHVRYHVWESCPIPLPKSKLLWEGAPELPWLWGVHLLCSKEPTQTRNTLKQVSRDGPHLTWGRGTPKEKNLTSI